jgi:RNA polymerase sigma factor (sigma-70 family)
MATGQMSAVLQHLRRATLRQDGGGMSDGKLLECFLARREEAAFEALVRRHGPMVLSVCRRVLHNTHDAEDAFQAAFLVLVRKAGSLRSRDTVGNWLYGVAFHTALKARAMAMKRRTKEAHAGARLRPKMSTQELATEWHSILDQELSRLPEKYREAIVLCDLEGKTRTEAARQVGIPEGTLSGRLTTGRRKLAQRLTHRGLALSGGALAVALGQSTVSASVPIPLLASTIRAAACFAAGQTAAGVISAEVAALAKGVLKTMLLGKLKLGAAIAFILSAFVGGICLHDRQADAREADGPRTVARLIKAPEAPKEARVQARTVLKDATEAAEDIEDKQWKAWLLQYIGEVQAKAGEREAAAKTFEQAILAAKEIRGRSKADPLAEAHHTLCWIACAQATAGDVKAARQTVESIDEDGARDYAMANLGCALARAGDLKGALETTESVSFNKKDWVYEAVAVAQAEAGKLKEAMETAEKISGDPCRTSALTALAKAKAKAKDRDGAAKFLEEALKRANDLDGEEGDQKHVALYRVVEVQANLGDLKEARRTADTITKEVWRDNALHTIVTTQANAGDFKEALKTADAIAGEYKRGEAAKDVVVAQLRSGDLKGGQTTAGAVPSIYWRVVTLTEIAMTQAKKGDRNSAAKTFRQAFEQAGDDAEKVRDNEPGIGGLREGCLSQIAEAQAAAGEEKAALAWAAKQSSAQLKTKALISVAKGLALREQAEKEPQK